MSSLSGKNAVFPVEVLELIYPHCDTPTLGRLMSVSIQCYILAVPHLYRTLVIDLTKETNPLYHHGVAIANLAGWDGREGDGPSAGETRETTARPKRKSITSLFRGLFRRSKAPSAKLGIAPLAWSRQKSSSSPPPPSLINIISFLPDRFSFTQHLTITSHSSTQCRPFASLVMPNLHTLRIRPDPDDTYLYSCKCGHTPAEDGCIRGGSACRLLEQLRPRRLVMGGQGTSLSGPAFKIWGATSLPTSIKEIVIFLGDPMELYGPKDGKSTNAFDEVPDTVERLTFVDVSYGPHAVDPSLMPMKWETYWLRLAWASVGRAGVVEVVGFGKIEGTNYRGWVACNLMTRGWSFEAAQDKAASIRIAHDKAEYDRREGAEAEPREKKPVFKWERPNHLRPL